MLDIRHNGISIPSGLVLDLEALEISLRSSVPSTGGLCEVGIVDHIKVLMWEFQERQPCSNATEQHFVGVDETEKLYSVDNMNMRVIKKNVSLSYFTLEIDELQNCNSLDESQRRTKVMYQFPDENEAKRVSALSHCLSVHLGRGYRIEKLDRKRATHHFCQFSGGGDLCITKSLTGPPLIYTTEAETGYREDAEPSTSSNKSAEFSPPAVGSPKFTSLIIEGKKTNTPDDDFKHQLWANMIVITVGKFVDSISSKILQMTKKDLLEVKQLNAYGIACTGSGKVGMYKLQMNMIKGETKFIKKLSIGNHGQLNAAIIMDYGLEQFTDTMSK